MTAIQQIMGALEERSIARTIGIPHDEARMRYPLSSNTVDSFEAFAMVTGDYLNHHTATCVTHGGRMSTGQAQSRAKGMIEREYRQNNGDIVSAYNDAHDGTNGGMRRILDIIADACKAEAIQDYVRSVFDSYVAPNSWEDKVEIIRQFMQQFDASIPSNVRRDQPERYAQNYRELIDAFVQGLRKTSSMFRRL
jgi:hypothetical protein